MKKKKAVKSMIDCYKRIARTSFLAALLSCAAILLASVNLCMKHGNKYIMIVAIIINSVCATINIQHYIKYKRKIRQEEEKCFWNVWDRYCLKNDTFCFDKQRCPDYSSEARDKRE